MMKCEDCGDREETHSLEVRVTNSKTCEIVLSHPLWLCEECARKAFRQITGDE